MNFTEHPKNILNILLIIIYIQYVGFAAVINTTSTTKTTSTPITQTIPLTTSKSSLAFTQPTFNFDFSSMRDRSTAQTAMTDARANWGNFFT